MLAERSKLVKLFFEQYESLFLKVPKMARVQQGDNENSKYTNCASYNKNCYLLFTANHNEDSMYGKFVLNSQDCYDCFVISRSELGYELNNCGDCYDSKFLLHCEFCSDCAFCVSCISCKNCFGCVNLRNKEYYFLNEKCSKDEYEEKILALDLGNSEKLKQYRNNFVNFCKKIPQRSANIRNSENSIGHDIFNSKNCLGFGVFNSDNCRYVQNVDRQNNSYDGQGWKGSWCLETQTCDESWETAFSLKRFWHKKQILIFKKYKLGFVRHKRKRYVPYQKFILTIYFFDSFLCSSQSLMKKIHFHLVNLLRIC